MLPKILDFIGPELESCLPCVPLSRSLPTYAHLLPWFQQSELVWKLLGEEFQLVEPLCLMKRKFPEQSIPSRSKCSLCV